MIFCMKVSFVVNYSESLWILSCPLILCSDHFLLSCCSFASSLHPHRSSSVVFLPHFPSVWKDQVWRIHMFHCGSCVYLGCWVDQTWVFTAHWSLGDTEGTAVCACVCVCACMRVCRGMLVMVRGGSGKMVCSCLPRFTLSFYVKNIETFYLDIIYSCCHFFGPGRSSHD